ncbi:hypothetical protein BAUCODRAFT_22604 [Baudoinia panamericana UAMH 10762]|uniref:Uncharacterized protein n=1 Tax=Baudoinia panamericana (strain UAMH 10762) TaxID=717646 RepID=M2NJP5_BAUPA|nr:uncharacterized protein BAUCODRAFT_22604 [Baudoinia panamericana UAMH 10762]EMC99365.1 hypothetical protein BAUCODRAFT_22604 [Baudoinia panamericana UAMH 10762]
MADTLTSIVTTNKLSRNAERPQHFQYNDRASHAYKAKATKPTVTPPKRAVPNDESERPTKIRWLTSEPPPCRYNHAWQVLVEAELHCAKEKLTRYARLFRQTPVVTQPSMRDMQYQTQDQEPTAFQMPLEFTNTGRIHSREEGSRSSDQESHVQSDGEWSWLSNAWLLGEYVGSEAFKDAIADALVRKPSRRSM